MHRSNTLRLGVALGVATLTVATSASLAAPVVDQLAGLWTDTFSSTDAIPGQSVSISDNIGFGGTQEDGTIRLVPPPRAPEPGFIVQADWSGGETGETTTVLAGETRFRSATDNVLFENFPGRLVLAPIVIGQPGALPFEKGPIAPIRQARSAVDYYGYSAFSINAPEPGQSQTAFLYFYRDTTDGVLSMVFISNERNSTGGNNNASVYWNFWPLMEGDAITVSDDPDEFTESTMEIDGETVRSGAGRWSWLTCCSDGGAITLASSEFYLSGQIIGGATIDGGDNGLDVWIQSYDLRFYTELDANAYTTLLLQQPTDSDQVPGDVVWMSGSLSGRMNSMFIDLGEREGLVRWGDLNFDAEVAEGGALRIFVRSGETQDALRSADWQGPITESGSSLEGLLTDGHRFVQYRVDMEVPDPSLTPDQPDSLTRLNELRLEFTEVFDDALEPDGEALSATISPDPKPWAWTAVTFTSTTVEEDGDTVLVDVLDGSTFETLLEDVASGTDISTIDPDRHPTLRLRARLHTDNLDPATSPTLDAWGVTWIVDSDEDDIPNDDDNCPFLFNPDQLDSDM
ncbi:MAG: hypothetical protein AAFX99_33440, partial [Myxococcota bacterium]